MRLLNDTGWPARVIGGRGVGAGMTGPAGDWHGVLRVMAIDRCHQRCCIAARASVIQLTQLVSARRQPCPHPRTVVATSTSALTAAAVIALPTPCAARAWARGAGQRDKRVDRMPVIMRTWSWLTPTSDWSRANARPRSCLPQDSGNVPGLGARGRQPPGTRQRERGAERPGDIGLLAGRREPFGCCFRSDLSRPLGSLSPARLIPSSRIGRPVWREAPASRLPCPRIPARTSHPQGVAVCP